MKLTKLIILGLLTSFSFTGFSQSWSLTSNTTGLQNTYSQGVENVVVMRTALNPNSNPGPITITSFSFITGGAYNMSQIKPNSVKLWYGGYSSIFVQDRMVLLGTGTISTTAGAVVNVSISNFHSITSDNPYRYLFVTIDIENTSIPGMSNFFRITSLAGVGVHSPGNSFSHFGSYTPSISIGTPTSIMFGQQTNYPGGSVVAGESILNLNHIYGYQYSSTYSLNHINFSTSGTFLASDVVRFELLHSFYDNILGHYRYSVISTLPGVDAGTPLSFHHLPNRFNQFNQYFDNFTYNFLLVRAVISSTAGVGRTLALGEFSTNNMSINGLASISPVSVSNSRPMITFVGSNSGTYYNNQPAANLLPKGTFDNNFYSLRIVPVYNDFAKTFTVTLTGSYTSSDINAFKLYFNTNSSSFNNNISYYITSVTSAKVGSSEILTFNVNTPLVANLSTYFFIAADIANNATENATVYAVADNNSIATSGPATFTGTLSPGNVFTIVNPILNYTQMSAPTTASGVELQHVAYKFKLTSSVTPSRLQSLVLTASGTATTSDIAYVRLYIGTEPYFSSNFGSYGSSATFSTSTPMTISGINYNVHLGEEYYAYVYVFVNSAATIGRNFRIGLAGTQGIVVRAGMVNGTPSQGEMHTIKPGSVHISPITSPGVFLPKAPTQYYQYAAIRLDVTGSSTAFHSHDLISSGSYTSADIGYFYKVELSNTPDAGGINYIATYQSNSTSTGSGENFTVNFNYTLFPGTYYIKYFTRMGTSATTGRTIGISTVTAWNFGSYTTVTGSSGSSALSTVIGSSVTVTSINSGNILKPYIYFNSSTTKPIYTIAVQTGLVDAFVNNIVLSFSGTANVSSDFSSLYLTSSNVYPYDGNYYNSASSSSNNVANFNFSGAVLPANSTTYFYLIPYYASNLNKTIQVKALDVQNSFIIQNGTASGMAFDGNVMTVMSSFDIAPNTISTTNLYKGASDNVIYSFSTHISSWSYLDRLVFTLSGTFTPSDIANFTLSTSYYSNAYNRNIVATKPYISGNIIEFGGPGANLAYVNGTVYFYLSADSKAGATTGRTIAADLDESKTLLSNTNITIDGSAPKGSTSTITEAWVLKSDKTYPTYYGPGTTYAPLHRWLIVGSGVSSSVLTISSFSFLVQGTYNANYVVPNSLKLWATKTSPFTFFEGTSTLLGQTNLPIAGNIATISTNSHVRIPSGEDTYLYLTMDLVNTSSGTNTSFINIYSLTGIVAGSTSAPFVNNTIGYTNNYYSYTTSPSNFQCYQSNTYNASFVAAGTKHVELNSFYSYHNGASASLGAVIFTTSGTFLSTDVDRFELVLERYFPEAGAYKKFVISTLPGVNNGAILTFMPNLGLPNHLHADYYNYYYVNVNFAHSAVPGRTLRLSNLNFSTDLFFNGLTISSSASSASRPFLTISGGAVAILNNNIPNSRNISPDQNEMNIFGFALDARGISNLSTIVVTMSGTYTSSDISRFRLYFGNNSSFSTNSAYYVTSIPSTKVGSQEVLTFNFSRTLQNGYANFLYLAVDIPATATQNRTIAASINPSGVILTLPNTISGSAVNGNVFTIASPVVNYVQNSTGVSSIVGIDVFSNVYSFELTPGVSNTTLKYLIITTSGNATSSDVSTLYLEISSNPTFDPNNRGSYSSVSYSPNTEITFSGMNYDLTLNTPYYIHIISKTTSSATSGRNFRVGIPDLTSIGTTGTKSGTVHPAKMFTIMPGRVVLSPLSLPAKSLVRGVPNQHFASTKLTVSHAPVYFNSLTSTISGNFTSSDFSNFVRLYLSTENTITGNNIVVVDKSTTSSSGSGESFTRSFGVTLSQGEYYIHFATTPSNNAMSGREIYLSSITSLNFSGNVTVSGNSGSGSVNTIVGATVTVTSINGPDTFYPINTIFNTSGIPPVYTIKIEVGSFPVYLTNIVLTSTGTVNVSSDFSSLYMIEQSSYPYNYSLQEGVWGNSSSTIHTYSINKILNANTTKYYYFIPYNTYSSSIGKNYKIKALDLVNGIKFNGSTATGITSDGNDFVISNLARLSNSTVSSDNLGRGVNDNIIYAFKIKNASSTANFLKNVVVTLSGTLPMSEVTNLRLSYSFYSNETSRSPLASAVVSGNLVTIGGTSNLISLGTTGEYYFFIGADISATATNGATLSAKVLENRISFSVSNITTSGILNQGPSKVVSGSTVVIRNNTLPASGICPCNSNAYFPIYSFEVEVKDAPTVLNAISFTGMGTFTASDFYRLHIFYTTDGTTHQDFDDETSLTYINPTSGSGQIFYYTLNRALTVGKHYFYLRMRRTNVGSTVGNTIIIAPPNINGIVFNNNPAVSGTLSTGATHTIIQPSVTISNHDIPSGFLSPGSIYNAIKAAKIVVNSDCADLYQYTVSISGMYSTNDFTNTYFFLSTTTSFSFNNNVAYNGYSMNAVNSTTGPFALVMYPGKVLYKGTYYLFTAVNVGNSPDYNAYIRIVNDKVENYGITSTTPNGTLQQTGNTFYIGNSNMFIEGFTLPGSNILRAGNINQPIYYMSYTVTGASHYIQNMYSHFLGNYVGATDMKIHGFKVWKSSTTSIDATSTLLYTYTPTSNGISGDGYYSYIYHSFDVGSGYIIYTVDPSESVTAGRNIYINYVSHFHPTTNLSVQNTGRGNTYSFKATQTILNFGPFADIIFTGTVTSFSVNPTANSGIPVSVSIVTDPATGVADFISGIINILGPGSVTITASNLGNASYDAITASATFKIVTTSGIVPPPPTSIASKSNETSVSLAPNPAQDYIQVFSQDKINLVQVYDAIGNLVLSTKTSVINISGLPNGLYFASVATAKGKVVLRFAVLK